MSGFTSTAAAIGLFVIGTVLLLIIGYYYIKRRRHGRTRIQAATGDFIPLEVALPRFASQLPSTWMNRHPGESNDGRLGYLAMLLWERAPLQIRYGTSAEYTEAPERFGYLEFKDGKPHFLKGEDRDVTATHIAIKVSDLVLAIESVKAGAT